MSDTKKIGARIVLDGEAEFRQSITNSNAALKQFDSELKLTAEQFKNNEKSMEALQKVQATYQKQQATLRKQEQTYTEQLEKASKAHEEATQIHEKTAKSVETLRKKLEDAKRIYGEDSEEVRKLSKELDKAEESYKKEEKAITGLETKMIKWETSLNETRTELTKTDKALEEVNHNIDNYDDYIREAADETAKANPEIEKLGISMGQLVGAELIADGIKAMARACVDLAKASIDVGMQFEASMSNVEALSGASGEALDSLRDKARDMGASTIYSASQAADAMGYMALAGWNAKQMIEGIEPVLNLAAAADMELATASDIVTDYLTAFGLEASDAAHFTDMMATAMSTSNTTVEMLGESYKHVAATAHSMGIEVEDVTAVLATMANAGVKGGEAGTALNTILVRLATNAQNCADKLEAYGVHVYDSSESMNDLSYILEGMEHIWVDLSDAEQAALAKSIAGTNQYSKLQTVMQGVSQAAQEGGQSFYDYADALRDCDGSAEKMADTMQDNLKGKLTILDSALQALGESMYDVFDENLKLGVDGATDAVTRLNNAVKTGDMHVSLEKMSKSLNKLIDNVVGWIEGNMPKLIDGMTKIIDNADKIAAALKGIAVGLVLFKSATSLLTLASAAMKIYTSATQAATVAQTEMNLAANANPYILLTSTLAGGALAVMGWVEANEKAAHSLNETAEATHRLVESTKSANESFASFIEERQDARASLEYESEVAKGLADRLLDLNSQTSLTADEQKEMASAVEQLNSVFPELNLKIDEHGKLTKESTEALRDNIDAMLEQAKVEAAREDLTSIAKEQFEAEKNLAAAKETVKKAVLDAREAQRLYDEDLKNHVDMNGNLVEVENEYSIALENAKNELIRAQVAEAVAAEAVDKLGQEYADTVEYIDAHSDSMSADADSIAEVGEAAEKTTGELLTMSEEFQKQVEELQKAVEQSLSTSNDIFNKTKDVESQNINDMRKNIDDHKEQLTRWGDSYEELASRVDDSTGLVLEYIANMGVEGQGYIDEMLKLDPTQLKEFTDSMVEALSLPDELASQVADDYTKAVKNAVDGMVKEAKDANAEGSELKNAEKELAEGMPEALDECLGEDGEVVQEKVDKAVSAVEKSITDKTPDVKKASEEMSKAIVDTINSNVSYDAFFSIGTSVGEGLSAGIRAGIEDVSNAAAELSKAAETTSKEKLEINSPSKLFRRFGNYVGQGFEQGIRDSMPDVISTLNATLPNEKNVTAGTARNDSQMSNNAINQLSKMLAQYIPQMATNTNTNVNVTLEGDAKGIFKVVQKENTRIIKATGYQPLVE